MTIASSRGRRRRVASRLDQFSGERALLLQFYAAKLAAVRRDASGALRSALMEAMRRERHDALAALTRKWEVRRAAAREDRRRAQRQPEPSRPQKFEVSVPPEKKIRDLTL